MVFVLSQEQAVSDLERLVPKLLDQSALTVRNYRSLKAILEVLGDEDDQRNYEMHTDYSTIRHYNAIVSLAESLLERYRT